MGGSFRGDLGQSRSGQHWPNLYSAKATNGHPRRPVERRVEIGRLDELEAEQVLFRLDERAIGQQSLAVAHAYARGRLG